MRDPRKWGILEAMPDPDEIRMFAPETGRGDCACGDPDAETRYGVCFDCATTAENLAKLEER